MNCLFRLTYAVLYVLIVNFTVSAQDLPFVYYAQPTLASGQVLAFQQNSNREIQILSASGLDVFDGKRTRKLLSFQAHGISDVKQALFSDSNTLLVLTNQALYAFDLQKAEKRKLYEGALEKVFFDARLQQVYVQKGATLYAQQEQGAPREVLKKTAAVHSIIFGKTETVVVGAQRLDFYSPDWKLKESLALAEPVVDTYYNDGRLLVLSPEAIYSKEGAAGLKKFQNLALPEVSCILEDQAGRIWVGSQTAGVLLIDGSEKINLGKQHGFPLKSVQGLYESPDLSLWFYNREGIVYKAFSAPFEKYALGRHLAGDVVEDVYKIDSSSVALLTRNGYYHVISEDGIASELQSAVPFMPAFAGIVRADETIHVSGSGELLFFQKGRRISRSLKKNIVQLYPFQSQSLLVDEQGNVYGFDHQSHKLSSKSWQLVPHELLFRQGEDLVYTEPETGFVKKWNSAEGVHLSISQKVPDARFAALYQQEHLLYLSGEQELRSASAGGDQALGFRLAPKNQPLGMSLSGHTLWISTADKLFQLSLSLEHGQPKLGELKEFNAAEHKLQLPVLESIETLENHFLLTSANSFVRYDPLAMVPDITAPGLGLDKLIIKNKDSLRYMDLQGPDTLHVLLAGDEQLLIQAFAVQYGQQHRAVLKYRFLSSAHHWMEALENELIVLSSLEAGTHLLELASESAQGVKSSRRKFVLLTVNQVHAHRWWMLLGGSLGFLLLGFFAYSGVKSVKEGKGREAKEKYEKELMKLQRKSHEQMMKAEGLKQVNDLISAQKAELEDKNKQIVAQKYELSLTNNQIKQQKDLIQKTSESLQSSINYARRIQTALMGDEVVIKEDLAESFVFFKPRDQVSGDFFWFQKAQNALGEDVLVIAAVDCTGHGVPGAIVSVVGIQLLNAIVTAKGITDPGQILGELNASLLKSFNYEKTQINDGMDMSLCSIHLKSRKLFFAGAKNPLFIVENGELEIVKGDKQPIGGQKLREEKHFQTHEIPLKSPGTQMFYLFSDGYQDQFGGPDQSKFMLKSFKNLLIEISEKPAMEQKYILAKTLNDWQDKEEQTDDILVLGFRL